MQEVAFPRRKGRFDPSSLLVLLLLPGIPLGFTAEDGCEFPEAWAGEWFQYGRPNIFINTTTFGDRTCSQKISEDQYVVYSNADSCYQCMIITSPHENVIQYREGWGEKRGRAEELCLKITSDDILYSMFRVNAKPVACPFNGPPFTFSYNRGKKECATPPSLAERCTDESKLLLKYQACPDVESTESYTEELQCLAIWNDGRNKYFVGTLERKSPGVPNEKTYRCFLYEEEKNHHSSKVLYSIAQSGDPTCSGLYTVNEGSANIKLTRVDKEHTRCKYPHWVTTHHDWHSLDGTKIYHFTSKNATLKVKALGSNEDTSHEERIICHNIERFDPNDNKLGNKVKLVAHVTSGCDIGYVCMIFHQRDNHIIELQQSSQKAIMPEEACSSSDLSTMPYTTLITSSLHPRKCPHPGRYGILGYASMSNFRRQRRSEKLSKPAKRRTWHDNSEDEECRSTDIQIGCSSPEQNEMIIVNTCEHAEVDYFCHGSWEEKGVWHTIVSQKTPDLASGLGPTFCFSMRLGEDMQITSDRGSGPKQLPTQHQEQELLLSKPTTACFRNVTKEWVYRLTNQGVCEDLMKAASSAASSFTLSRIILSLSLGTTTLYKLLLSR